MQMDRIAEKMFEAYASASKSRYLFMRNMKTKHSRWSTNAVDFFGLPGEYMDDAYHTFLEHIHPEDKEQFQAEMDRVYSGLQDSHDMEYRARSKDGSYVVQRPFVLVTKADTELSKTAQAFFEYITSAVNLILSKYISSVLINVSFPTLSTAYIHK